MENERYEYKDAFAVIGVAGEGPAGQAQEWLMPLWPKVWEKHGEIINIVRKDENGGLLWWGAMNDIHESNQRWGETGKYMAGCEADTHAAAPEGWTKWVIPAQKYLVVSCTMDQYGEIFGRITNDPNITITGTVHERYPVPENPSILELWFPIG